MKKSKLIIHKVDLSKDRFRKLAYQYAELAPHNQLYYVFVGDVRKLLVREHAAIERLVRLLNQHWNVPHPGMDRYKYGYAEACEDLLAALKARRR